jgi:hypothetical protein
MCFFICQLCKHMDDMELGLRIRRVYSRRNRRETGDETPA